MSYIILLLFLSSVYSETYVGDQITQNLFACNTTDFSCFQRQYKVLRDHVLLGYKDLPKIMPYRFFYGHTGTCIKLTGLEQNVLIGMSFDSRNRQYSTVVQLPLLIEQVADNEPCEIPSKDFTDTQIPPEGEFLRYSGNATMQVTYPFILRRKLGEVFMDLKEEDVDLILDIPTQEFINKDNATERTVHERSEQAAEIVQHVDLAQVYAVPYTTSLRVLLSNVPLKNLINLKHGEKYSSLQMILYDFNDDNALT